MENTTLIQLVQTSGLEQTKQNQIAETLGSFFSKAAEWDATILSIVITSPDEIGKMKMAKEGRLTLKNMRLEGEKAVKSKRDDLKYKMANDVLEDKLWLKAGQMMEATFKNLETKLEEKENFKVRWDADQKDKLKDERLEQLLPLGFQFQSGFDLGNIDEAMFQSLKLGLETAKKDKEESERKAEAERLAKITAEAEAKAKMESENKRLKEESEAKENELKAERIKADAERKEAEAKAQKLKDEAEAKLKAERLVNDRLLAEIKAKEEDIAKAAKDASAKSQSELKAKRQAEAKALKAPKKQKLNTWIDAIALIAPAGLEQDETTTIIVDKFNSFKTWAKQQIELS